MDREKLYLKLPVGLQNLALSVEGRRIHWRRYNAEFSALLAEYTKAPEVTRRRIYIETLQDVMPGIRAKIIVDEQTSGILPLLNLNAQKGGGS